MSIETGGDAHQDEGRVALDRDPLDEMYPPTRMSPQMSSEQMAALEELVLWSRDLTEFAKRLVLYMLRQTNNLRTAVCMSIPETPDDDPEMETLDQQAGLSIYATRGYGHTTLFPLVLQAMGTDADISPHCGMYVNGQYDLKANGWTIWISPFVYGHGSYKNYKHLPFDLDAIRATEFPPTRFTNPTFPHAVLKRGAGLKLGHSG